MKTKSLIFTNVATVLAGGTSSGCIVGLAALHHQLLVAGISFVAGAVLTAYLIKKLDI